MFGFGIYFFTSPMHTYILALHTSHPRRPLVMSHGSAYRFSVLTKNDLGCVRSVDVGWSYRGDLMNPSSLCTWWTDCNSGLFVLGVRAVGADNPYK